MSEENVVAPVSEEPSPVIINEEPPKATLATELRKLADGAHHVHFEKLKNEILEGLFTNAKQGTASHIHNLEALPLPQVIRKLEEFFNGENLQFTVHRTNGPQGFFKISFNLDV